MQGVCVRDFFFCMEVENSLQAKEGYQRCRAHHYERKIFEQETYVRKGFTKVPSNNISAPPPPVRWYALQNGKASF